MKISKRLLSAPLILVLIVGLSSSSARPVHADSIADLQKQQDILRQQAQQALDAAEANKSVAQRAAERLSSVNGQIENLKGSINGTQGQISDTNSQIAQQNQQLALLQSKLRTIQDQVNVLLRQLYVSTVSQPDSLALFSNESVSKRNEEATQLSVLKKTASELAAKTQDQQVAVQQNIDSLNQSQRQLVALNTQQLQQQKGLADQKQVQANLQSNAVQTELQLEALAAQKKGAADEIAKKIKLLQATSNWGNQIVSSYNSGWYYTQTGNYTRMGNTYETVNDIGCLITSIAMVATYYGHTVTPTYMARNGSFDGGGSYYANTPSGLGITLVPSTAVKWSTVQSEITAGRPVIVSIYLPSVGALNSDGSSHFIVIYGSQDGKYLMQDPIGPSGRSYNLNQVRSMILVKR